MLFLGPSFRRHDQLLLIRFIFQNAVNVDLLKRLSVGVVICINFLLQALQDVLGVREQALECDL